MKKFIFKDLEEYLSSFFTTYNEDMNIKTSTQADESDENEIIEEKVIDETNNETEEDEAEEEDEAAEEAAEGEPDEQVLEDVEQIQELDAAAAGTGGQAGSGFSLMQMLGFGNSAIIESMPRELSIGAPSFSIILYVPPIIVPDVESVSPDICEITIVIKFCCHPVFPMPYEWRDGWCGETEYYQMDNCCDIDFCDFFNVYKDTFQSKSEGEYARDCCEPRIDKNEICEDCTLIELNLVEIIGQGTFSQFINENDPCCLDNAISLLALILEQANVDLTQCCENLELSPPQFPNGEQPFDEVWQDSWGEYPYPQPGIQISLATDFCIVCEEDVIVDGLAGQAFSSVGLSFAICVTCDPTESYGSSCCDCYDNEPVSVLEISEWQGDGYENGCSDCNISCLINNMQAIGIESNGEYGCCYYELPCCFSEEFYFEEYLYNLMNMHGCCGNDDRMNIKINGDYGEDNYFDQHRNSVQLALDVCCIDGFSVGVEGNSIDYISISNLSVALCISCDSEESGYYNVFDDREMSQIAFVDEYMNGEMDLEECCIDCEWLQDWFFNYSSDYRDGHSKDDKATNQFCIDFLSTGNLLESLLDVCCCEVESYENEWEWGNGNNGYEYSAYASKSFEIAFVINGNNETHYYEERDGYELYQSTYSSTALVLAMCVTCDTSEYEYRSGYDLPGITSLSIENGEHENGDELDEGCCCLDCSWISNTMYELCGYEPDNSFYNLPNIIVYEVGALLLSNILEQCCCCDGGYQGGYFDGGGEYGEFDNSSRSSAKIALAMYQDDGAYTEEQTLNEYGDWITTYSSDDRYSGIEIAICIDCYQSEGSFYNSEHHSYWAEDSFDLSLYVNQTNGAYTSSGIDGPDFGSYSFTDRYQQSDLTINLSKDSFEKIDFYENGYYDGNSNGHDDHNSHEYEEECIHCEIDCELNFDIIYENEVFACCRDDKDYYSPHHLEEYHIHKQTDNDFHVNVGADEYMSESFGSKSYQEIYEMPEQMYVNGMNGESLSHTIYDSEYSSQNKESRFGLTLCASCESDEYIYLGDSYPSGFDNYLEGNDSDCCFDCEWVEEIVQDLAQNDLKELKQPELLALNIGGEILDQAIECCCEEFNVHDNSGAENTRNDYERLLKGSKEIKLDLYYSEEAGIETGASRNIEYEENGIMQANGWEEGLSEGEFEQSANGSFNSEISIEFCLKCDSVQYENYDYDSYYVGRFIKSLVENYEQEIYAKDTLSLALDVSTSENSEQESSNETYSNSLSQSSESSDESSIEIDLELEVEQNEQRSLDILNLPFTGGSHIYGLSFDNDACIECEDIVSIFDGGKKGEVLNIDKSLVNTLIGESLDVLCCAMDSNYQFELPHVTGVITEFSHSKENSSSLKLEIEKSDHSSSEFDFNQEMYGENGMDEDNQWISSYTNINSSDWFKGKTDIALCIETNNYDSIYGTFLSPLNFYFNQVSNDQFKMQLHAKNKDFSTYSNSVETNDNSVQNWGFEKSSTELNIGVAVESNNEVHYYDQPQYNEDCYSNDNDVAFEAQDYEENGDCFECYIDCEVEFDIIPYNDLFSCCRCVNDEYEYYPCLEYYNVHETSSDTVKININFKEFGAYFDKSTAQQDIYVEDNLAYTVNDKTITSGFDYIRLEIDMCSNCDENEHIRFGQGFPGASFRHYMNPEDAGCCFDCEWITSFVENISNENIANLNQPNRFAFGVGAEIINKALECCCEEFNQHDSYAAAGHDNDFERSVSRSNDTAFNIHLDKNNGYYNKSERTIGENFSGDVDFIVPDEFTEVAWGKAGTDLSIEFCMECDSFQYEDYDHERYREGGFFHGYTVDEYDQEILAKDTLELTLDIGFDSNKSSHESYEGDIGSRESNQSRNRESSLDVDLILKTEQMQNRSVNYNSLFGVFFMPMLAFDSEICIDCEDVVGIFNGITNTENPSEPPIEIDRPFVNNLLTNALGVMCCTLENGTSIDIPFAPFSIIDSFNHEIYESSELKIEIVQNDDMSSSSDSSQTVAEDIVPFGDWMLGNYSEESSEYQDTEISIALCIKSESYDSAYGSFDGLLDFNFNRYSHDKFSMQFMANKDTSWNDTGTYQNENGSGSYSEIGSQSSTIELSLVATSDNHHHYSAGESMYNDDNWEEPNGEYDDCCVFDTEWYYDRFIDRFENGCKDSIFDSECFNCNDERNGWYYSPRGDIFEARESNDDVQLALFVENSKIVDAVNYDSENMKKGSIQTTTTEELESRTAVGLALDVDCHNSGYKTIYLEGEDELPAIQIDAEDMDEEEMLRFSDEMYGKDDTCCIDCEWVQELVLEYSQFDLNNYEDPCCVAFDFADDLVAQAIDQVCCECDNTSVMPNLIALHALDSFEYRNETHSELKLAFAIDSRVLDVNDEVVSYMPDEQEPFGIMNSSSIENNFDAAVELCISCNSSEYGYYSYDDEVIPNREYDNGNSDEYDSCCEFEFCEWYDEGFYNTLMYDRGQEPEIDIQEYVCESIEEQLYLALQGCGCHDCDENGEGNGEDVLQFNGNGCGYDCHIVCVNLQDFEDGSIQNAFVDSRWDAEEFDGYDEWGYSFETSSIVDCDTCNNADEITYQGGINDENAPYQTDYEITTYSVIAVAATFVNEQYNYTEFESGIPNWDEVNGNDYGFNSEPVNCLESFDLTFLSDVIGDFADCCCEHHQINVTDWVLNSDGDFSFNSDSHDNFDMVLNISTQQDFDETVLNQDVQITDMGNLFTSDAANGGANANINMTLALSMDCWHEESGSIEYSGDTPAQWNQDGGNFFDLADYVPQSQIGDIESCCPDIDILDGIIDDLVDGMWDVCPEDAEFVPVFANGSKVQEGYTQLGLVVAGASDTFAEASLYNQDNSYGRGFSATHYTSFVASLVMCTGYEQFETWYSENEEYSWPEGDFEQADYGRCDIGCVLELDPNLIEDILIDILDGCCINDLFMPPDIPYIGELEETDGYNVNGSLYSQTEMTINLSINICVNEDGSLQYSLTDNVDGEEGNGTSNDYSVESGQQLTLDFAIQLTNESEWEFWEYQYSTEEPMIEIAALNAPDIFTINLESDTENQTIDLDPNETIQFGDVIDIGGFGPGLDLGDAVTSWMQDGDDVVATLQNGADLTLQDFGTVPLAGGTPMVADLQAELNNQNITVEFVV